MSELLNQGSGNAIPASRLEKVTGLDTRDLYSQIERERREGKPIIAKKNDGGGFYLPESSGEMDAYLYNKMNQVITEIETNLSIRHGKRKALDNETKSFIRALVN